MSLVTLRSLKSDNAFLFGIAHFSLKYLRYMKILLFLCLFLGLDEEYSNISRRLRRIKLVVHTGWSVRVYLGPSILGNLVIVLERELSILISFLYFCGCDGWVESLEKSGKITSALLYTPL